VYRCIAPFKETLKLSRLPQRTNRSNPSSFNPCEIVSVKLKFQLWYMSLYHSVANSFNSTPLTPCTTPTLLIVRKRVSSIIFSPFLLSHVATSFLSFLSTFTPKPSVPTPTHLTRLSTSNPIIPQQHLP
jgi:hypothetical protein